MSLSGVEGVFLASGKVALVTGGGSGIGAAVAHELARAGARIVVADINIRSANEVASQLGDASAVQMDVTDRTSILRVIEALPSLDILINNAGIGLVGDIVHTSTEDFSRVMQVNVNSVFYVTQAAMPLLLRSRGSIVNIASVAGLVGVKQRFAYCASKGAVIAMTRQLAVDFPKELRVNCVCPGTVDSPFVAGYLAKYHAGEEEQVREQLKARQPVGRLGRPEEVASLVRYLCSPEADFMHGSVMTLDGGWTAA
ncbi:MAG: SDR family oxidoreductase [Acidobacteriota bacterium]|nr:SDR family oxidoreductase [Acidobacteriota bacterium]